MTFLPSIESGSSKSARFLTLLLVVVTVSSCATGTVTENKTGEQQEITVDENRENKKESKKHRIRSWNRLSKRAAKEIGRIDKGDQDRGDELQNRHPEIKNKQGHLHSHPETKRKYFGRGLKNGAGTRHVQSPYYWKILQVGDMKNYRHLHNKNETEEEYLYGVLTS